LTQSTACRGIDTEGSLTAARADMRRQTHARG